MIYTNTMPGKDVIWEVTKRGRTEERLQKTINVPQSEVILGMAHGKLTAPSDIISSFLSLGKVSSRNQVWAPFSKRKQKEKSNKVISDFKTDEKSFCLELKIGFVQPRKKDDAEDTAIISMKMYKYHEKNTFIPHHCGINLT